MAGGRPNRIDQRIDVDTVCNMILRGDTQDAIAASIKVDAAELCRWIAADEQRSARVREARSKSAEAFAGMAIAEIRSAADPFELAKAKELAHHYRWMASKRNPKDFGDKVQNEVTGADGGPVNLGIQVLFGK